MEKTSKNAHLLLIPIYIILLFLIVTLYVQLRSDKITDILKKDAVFSILLSVSDQDKHIMSQVMMVSGATGKIGFLDVPGNTGIIIKKLNKVDRIDRVFYPGDIQLYKESIEDLIGIPIEFSMQIDISRLSKAVDLVGGVELFVPNPVEWESGQGRQLLPSGSLRLDGGKALTYLLYSEKGEPEIDRVGRRQKFLQSFLRSWVDSSGYLIHKEVAPVFYKLWKTDLDRRSFEKFYVLLNNLDIERTVLQRILGLSRVVDGQELLFPHYDSRLLKETVVKLQDTLSNKELVGDDELSVTVEILNGTERNGLASRTAQIFQSFGVDVATVKNADRNDYEMTVIIDNRGNRGVAERIGKYIQCTKIKSQENETIESLVDVTIILGKDFDGRYVKD